MMKKLLFNPARLVTVDTKGKNIKRGSELSDIALQENSSVIIEEGKITDIVNSSSVNQNNFDELIDVSGKVVLPGLVECHTHSAFTGSRADEFRKKIAGVSYEEIAKQGGGINATVNAVRNSSFEEIVNTVKPRIDNFISQGVTTLEIKSGYGLDFDNEIKLLQVINYLNEIYSIDIVSTFLGAHTFPPEFKDDKEGYVTLIIEKMLPYISKNNLANFCDGFCEITAFSADETDRIFSRAKEFDLNLRLHTEQFNSIGGLDIALKHNAVTVDHLEVLKENDVNKLADSDTVSVLLPGVSFFLNYQYAPARKLIDSNAIVALSTDYNPGSSHISNLPFIMSLAALKMKMKIEETISAVTINAAAALKMNSNIGSIEIGKNADFAVFDTSEYANIVYDVGRNLNWMTIKNGEVVYQAVK